MTNDKNRFDLKDSSQANVKKAWQTPKCTVISLSKTQALGKTATNPTEAVWGPWTYSPS